MCAPSWPDGGLVGLAVMDIQDEPVALGGCGERRQGVEPPAGLSSETSVLDGAGRKRAWGSGMVSTSWKNPGEVHSSSRRRQIME